MCRFVAQQIQLINQADIATSYEAGHPTVLVIAPSQFGRRIYQHLQEQGIPNVHFGSRPRFEHEVLDGYRRLVRNERSRLGWRLVLHATQPQGWQDIVRRALLDGADLVDLLAEEFRSPHLGIVDILRRLLAGESITEDDQQRLEAATGLPLAALRERLELDEPPPEEQLDEEAPRVVVTTLSGAKGLQAEHVFVVGLNEQHFPRSNAAPSEDEVCQLLVALTHARQSCTLVSCNRFGNQTLPQSVFLQWLGPLLETLPVNAAYWNQ